MTDQEFNAFVNATLDYVSDVTKTLTAFNKHSSARVEKEKTAKRLAEHFCQKAAGTRLGGQPLVKSQEALNKLSSAMATHDGAIKVALGLLDKYAQTRQELETEKAASLAHEPGKAAKQAAVQQEHGVRYRTLSKQDQLWIQVNQN
jgi:hypothetical protein